MIKCICCNGSINYLFSLGKQPLANKYPAKVADFDNEFQQEMKVYNCDNCGYCHVPCSASRSIFFEDYYYLSSVNMELVAHFERLAESISLLQPKLVVDVGSNDGILLKPLIQKGINAIGIDPSENVGAIANKNGYKTYIGFFDRNAVELILSEHGRADVITASSVFTHLEDPNKFFEDANLLLNVSGRVIIEVEFLNKIIESLGFERFYYDRPNYYTIESIKELAQKHDFEVKEIVPLDVHGGSVQVTLVKSSSQTNEYQIRNFKEYSLQKFSPQQILENFSRFAEECNKLKEKLYELKRSKMPALGYGCPARFSTITNFADIDSELIPYVIDDSPLKQDRFSPGKHIPIIRYENGDQNATYMVFAYEYIDSIRKRMGNRKPHLYRPIPLSRLA